MGPGPHICPRCGSADRIQESANQSRCAECGLGATSAPLVAMHRGGAPQPAEIERLLRTMEQRDQVFFNAPFPVYGLDATWTGLRSFGGHGSSNGVTGELSLAFGVLMDRDAPELRVATILPSAGAPDGPRDLAVERSRAATSLVMHLTHEVGPLPDDLRASAFPYRDPNAFGTDTTASWDDFTIAIDSQPVLGKVLTVRDNWIALITVGDLLVGLTARQWELASVGLVTVTDFAVYAAGSAEVRRRWRPNRAD